MHRAFVRNLQQSVTLFMLEAATLGILGAAGGAAFGRVALGVIASIGIPLQLPGTSGVAMLRPMVSNRFIVLVMLVAALGAVLRSRGAAMANAFTLEELDGKIALLTFDLPGKSVNTFGQPVMHELAGLVKDLAKRTDLRGLLLRSGKPGQFIAGADLNELGALAYYTKEQIAPGLAIPSNRAAMLTPSPIRSPSFSSTTSPR